MPRPDGGIAHAEIQFGDSRIMLADEDSKTDSRGPSHYGGSPVTLNVYLQDVDASTEQATSAGATVIRPLADQFYSNLTAGLQDPFRYSAEELTSIPAGAHMGLSCGNLKCWVMFCAFGGERPNQ